MISAKVARTLARNTIHIEPVNTNAGVRAKQDAFITGMTQNSIINAIKAGCDSCISYILNNNVINKLRSHGFTVEEEIEEDLRFHVISWENNASKDQSNTRGQIRTGFQRQSSRPSYPANNWRLHSFDRQG